MDCKFFNFGVKIEKVLKLHGLKMYFPLKYRLSNLGFLWLVFVWFRVVFVGFFLVGFCLVLGVFLARFS